MQRIKLTDLDRLEMVQLDAELEAEEVRKNALRRQQREHEQSVERQKAILRRPKQLKKK